MMGGGLITSGVVGYAGGTTGPAQIPSGAFITSIIAHATAGGASFAIFGGASAPIAAGQTLQIYFSHALWQAQGSTGQASTQVVFTGTDAYWVEYVSPRG